MTISAHPTAIRERASVRHRYAGSRIWAIFEPRSNTTRRAVFQQTLPDALKLADGVFISEVARLDQIPATERLDPKAVVEAIAASGRPAFYEPDVAHIIERLVPLLKEKDVVAIFSNGGFDGIHEKLWRGEGGRCSVAAIQFSAALFTLHASTLYSQRSPSIPAEPQPPLYNLTPEGEPYIKRRAPTSLLCDAVPRSVWLPLGIPLTP